MSQSTNKEHQDASNGQSYVGETVKESSRLVEVEPLENTPFVIVKLENKGWFIGYSGERITDCYETRDEAIESLKNNMWEVLFHMIVITIERHRGYLALQKEDVIMSGIEPIQE